MRLSELKPRESGISKHPIVALCHGNISAFDHSTKPLPPPQSHLGLISRIEHLTFCLLQTPILPFEIALLSVQNNVFISV